MTGAALARLAGSLSLALSSLPTGRRFAPAPTALAAAGGCGCMQGTDSPKIKSACTRGILCVKRACACTEWGSDAC